MRRQDGRPIHESGPGQVITNRSGGVNIEEIGWIRRVEGKSSRAGKRTRADNRFTKSGDERKESPASTICECGARIGELHRAKIRLVKQREVVAGCRAPTYELPDGGVTAYCQGSARRLVDQRDIGNVPTRPWRSGRIERKQVRVRYHGATKHRSKGNGERCLFKS